MTARELEKEDPLAPWAMAASIGRLHIVAIAALGTLTFGWLFTGERPFALALVCALDWFLVNLLNRVVDLEEDTVNRITGTDFVGRHPRTIARAGFALLAASFAATYLLAPALLPWRAAYHALGLTYNWPLLPGGKRIKQLYFWKNTASATGFLITCFAYPLAAAGMWRADAVFPPGITWSTVALTAAFFFLFELSYEVIYDLRDVEGDSRAAVRTYPVVHGVRRATQITDALILTSLACLVVGFVARVVPWRVAVMGIAPLSQLVLYKRALRRGITSADCIAITWLGASMLVAYHLWVILGLPGVR